MAPRLGISYMCGHQHFQLCLTLSAELLSWRRRPSVQSVNSGFSETAAWIQAKFCGKLPIRHISSFFLIFFFFLVDFLFSFFSIFFFFVFVNMGPMGAKISKCYFSHNFDPIATKLYDKYDSHGGIQAITFVAICQKLKILSYFEIFVKTGPYRAGNFKMLLLLQFSSDVSQTS